MKALKKLKLPARFVRELNPHVITLITTPSLLHEIVPPKTAEIIMTIVHEVADGKREMTGKAFSNFVQGKEEIYADYKRSERWWLGEDTELDHDMNTDNCRRFPHRDGLFPSRP